MSEKPMSRIGQCALAIACVFAACGGEPPAVIGVAIEEIPSPAGVGSGEPHLSSSGDAVYMSWLEAAGSEGHELRFARYREGAWSAPGVIAAGDDFLVNWADFPSVTPAPDGSLWAHWLQRGVGGGYDYGIRVTTSSDDGLTWSDPWTPHEDHTATEHGFVATLPMGDGMGFLWLDGRRFAAGPDGSPATREMALMFRLASVDGQPGPETVVDGRACDCCQTDAAVTSNGPVAVYRDRSPEEIRDIYITRWVDGAWTEGAAVHADGWETGACPVNGPAVAARGDDVVVAWFTAAEGEPLVKVAFSDDGGARFGKPTVVDGGTPAGRVDVLMLEDGSALVSWLTRTGGEAADVRVRRVESDGQAGEGVSVSASSSERASGFPRMAGDGHGTILLAWTDVAELTPRVRVARMEMKRQ